MASENLAIRGLHIDDNRTTTVKLEPEFWEMLQSICDHEGKSLSAMVRDIDRMRGHSPRTSAIRVFILKWFSSMAALGIERLTDLNKDHARPSSSDVEVRFAA